MKLIDGAVLDLYIALANSADLKQSFGIHYDSCGWVFVELIMQYELGKVVSRQDYLNMAVAAIAYRDSSSATWETINAELGNYSDAENLQSQVKASCIKQLPINIQPYIDAVTLFHALRRTKQGVARNSIEGNPSEKMALNVLMQMSRRCSQKLVIYDSDRVKLNSEVFDRDLVDFGIKSSVANLLSYSPDQELDNFEEKQRMDFFIKKSQKLEKEFAKLSLEEIAKRQHLKICKAWNEMNELSELGELERKIYEIGGRVQIDYAGYSENIVKQGNEYYLWCQEDYFGEPVVDYFTAIEYADQVFPRYELAKSKVEKTKNNIALLKKRIETMFPLSPLKFEAQYDLSVLEETLDKELNELTEAERDVKFITKDSASLKKEFEKNKYIIIC